MPTKHGPKRLVRVSLRLTEANIQYVNAEVIAGRYGTVNAYFSDLLDKHRTGNDSVTTQLRDAVVATLTQFRKDMSRDLRTMKTIIHASEGFQHALAKWLIVRIPKPAAEDKRYLELNGMDEYEYLLQRASSELIERRARADQGDTDADES
jgi:hypothetical protein